MGLTEYLWANPKADYIVKASVKNHDKLKQKYITNKLKCDFIRIPIK